MIDSADGGSVTPISLLTPGDKADTAAATGAWTAFSGYEGYLIVVQHVGTITAGTVAGKFQTATDDQGTGVADLATFSSGLAGAEAPIRAGNTLPIRNIPVGSTIHCVEMLPGKGAQIARSAGASVTLMAREGTYAQVRLRSGEVRKVHIECRATIGEVGNGEHSLRQIGKAGVKRWMGIRPTVRGVAMNPVDHPHGGGEGRTSGGRHPVTPWGKPTKGARTRHNKATDKMIIRSRHAKKKG